MCSRDDMDRAMSAALAPVAADLLRRHLYPRRCRLGSWERSVRTGALPASVAGFHAIVEASALPPWLKRAMIHGMVSSRL